MTPEQKSRIPGLYFSKQFRHIYRQDEVCAKIALKLDCSASGVYNYINSIGLAYPNLEHEVYQMTKRQKYHDKKS